MRKHSFKKLIIWQEAMDVIDMIYRFTIILPDYEKFGLQSQMNRCAVSIASNIAEGSGKGTSKHFKSYLDISLGSAYELETQLLICLRQNFINANLFNQIEVKVQKLQSRIQNFKDSL